MSNSTYQARMLGFPEINSAEDLSFYLRIPVEAVLDYAENSWESGYKTFFVQKKSGGRRELHAPVRELKFIQVWILRGILAHLHSSRASTAFEPGNSIAKNAARHVGQPYAVNLDLANFFPSIRAHQVFKIFASIGYNDQVSWLLTNLTTFKGKLPQGSPASPKLANLICNRMDARALGFCQSKNMVYSRYADDITISMSNRVHIKGTIRFVRYLAEAEGFSVRDGKTAVYGRKMAKRITGLTVTDEVRVGRQQYRRLRALIHTAWLKNDKEKLAYVEGYLHFLRDVDIRTFKLLWGYYSSIKSKWSLGSPPSTTSSMIAA